MLGGMSACGTSGTLSARRMTTAFGSIAEVRVALRTAQCDRCGLRGSSASFAKLTGMRHASSFVASKTKSGSLAKLIGCCACST